MTMTGEACIPFTYVLNDRLSILAVDDDPIQREFCAVYLAGPQADVTTAASAEDGLALLETTAFGACAKWLAARHGAPLPGQVASYGFYIILKYFLETRLENLHFA